MQQSVSLMFANMSSRIAPLLIGLHVAVYHLIFEVT